MLLKPLNAINVSITFSNVFLTSDFQINNLLTGNIKTHKMLKCYFKQQKRQLIPSHEYSTSFIALQFISQFFSLLDNSISPFLTDGGVTK
jgi:hypothetical protein